jgi:hypothetical protein
MSQVISGRPVWIGGYEFSNQLNAVALDHGADDLDATSLADTTRVHKGGLKSSGFSIEGFYDPESIDNVMYANTGLEGVPVAVAAQQGNEGEKAFFFNTVQGEYQNGGAIGELRSFTAGGMSRGDLVRGSIHINGSAITSSGATTGIQATTVSSDQRLFAALFVTSVSGTAPTLDVTVQSDDNGGFSSASDQITFAQATQIGAQIIDLSGPISDDYFRVDYSIGGIGPSFNFMVVIGIQ